MNKQLMSRICFIASISYLALMVFYALSFMFSGTMRFLSGVQLQTNLLGLPRIALDVIQIWFLADFFRILKIYFDSGTLEAGRLRRSLKIILFCGIGLMLVELVAGSEAGEQRRIAIAIGGGEAGSFSTYLTTMQKISFIGRVLIRDLLPRLNVTEAVFVLGLLAIFSSNEERHST